jgi:hypothetical protein
MALHGTLDSKESDAKPADEAKEETPENKLKKIKEINAYQLKKLLKLQKNYLALYFFAMQFALPAQLPFAKCILAPLFLPQEPDTNDLDELIFFEDKLQVELLKINNNYFIDYFELLTSVCKKSPAFASNPVTQATITQYASFLSFLTKPPQEDKKDSDITSTTILSPTGKKS